MNAKENIKLPFDIQNYESILAKRVIIFCDPAIMLS